MATKRTKKTEDQTPVMTEETVTPAAEAAPTETVVVTPAESVASMGDADVKETAKPERKGPRRSAKYTATRAQVDKTKLYAVTEAVELIKKLSYSKFPGTVTAHLVVREAGITATLTLPHSTGKTVRVAIVDDALLSEIAGGTITFDVLLATPQFMPKLAKLAPILGPKGLMPNPKNGTLTPNPEMLKKKLEAGSMTIKTEKKAPLMHISLGKTSMDTKQLAENLEAIFKSLKGKVLTTTIAASMSPSVKVAVVE